MIGRMMFAALMMVGVVCGQQAAPPEVVESAVKAVEDLGKQIVLGKHQVAIDRMYPKWKERSALRAGGMEKLEAQLATVGQEMAKRGVSLLSFKSRPGVISYEVWPGKKVVEVDGRQEEQMTYEKWMVLIPTETVMRLMSPATDGGTPKFYQMTSHGFQVAIADKDKLEWTFIDGSGVTVSELRSLFLTLPQDMKLPTLERKLAEPTR